MDAPGSKLRPTPREPGRRRFLKGSVVLSTSLAAGALRPAGGQPAPEEPWKVLGGPIRPYGERSRFEAAVRQKYGGLTDESNVGNWTPLQDLHGIITPSALHYEVHHQGVPDIDPERHRLLIHGMVERPVILTLEEIKRLPSVSRIHFLECAGNSQTEWEQPNLKTVQGTHGLTSCSEWTGVLLSLLLREAGVQKGGAWVVAEGADSSGHEHSIPMAKVMDDVLVAYGQNGEALRPENGYPVRLIVPGWEGGINVKWLRRLKVVDRPHMTRMETVEHTDFMPGGTARRFTFVMEGKSVITFPSGGQRLPGRGLYEVTGLAWSGRGAVRRVEVSTDGGKTWSQAKLQEPVLRFAHARFRFPWRWDGRVAILQSRCTDETGYVQPPLAELVKVRGLRSSFHNNAIQSWKVQADGSVDNVHV